MNQIQINFLEYASIIYVISVLGNTLFWYLSHYNPKGLYYYQEKYTKSDKKYQFFITFYPGINTIICISFFLSGWKRKK
jgi:hypothetical protein